MIKIISAFFAVYMFTMPLNIPRKFTLYCASLGGICWWIYSWSMEYSGSTMTGYFLASVTIAVLSHILARVKKAPVTIFLIAGILPLVPGAQIYYCIFNLLKNNFALSNAYLIEALQMAGSIAMAIFITDSIFRLVQLYAESHQAARG